MTACLLKQIMANANLQDSVTMDIKFIFNVDRLYLSSLSDHFNVFYTFITYEPLTMNFKAAFLLTWSSY